MLLRVLFPMVFLTELWFALSASAVSPAPISATILFGAFLGVGSILRFTRLLGHIEISPAAGANYTRPGQFQIGELLFATVLLGCLFAVGRTYAPLIQHLPSFGFSDGVFLIFLFGFIPTLLTLPSVWLFVSNQADPREFFIEGIAVGILAFVLAILIIRFVSPWEIASFVSFTCSHFLLISGWIGLLDWSGFRLSTHVQQGDG